MSTNAQVRMNADGSVAKMAEVVGLSIERIDDISRTRVVLDSADNGDLIVTGDGNGDAIRRGKGDGNVERRGRGDGDAIRDGDGDGIAYRKGEGDGSAIRRGCGRGNAYRTDIGDGDAIRDGDGDGCAIREGDGGGTAYRCGTGSGTAHRLGNMNDLYGQTRGKNAANDQVMNYMVTIGNDVVGNYHMLIAAMETFARHTADGERPKGGRVCVWRRGATLAIAAGK